MIQSKSDLLRTTWTFLVIFLFNQYLEAQNNPKTSNLNFYGKGRINGNIFYQCGRVTDYNKDADGSLIYKHPVSKFRSLVGLNLGIHLFESVYFRTTWNYNFNKTIYAPWNTTDYSYTIERAKWDFNSISYGYVNYLVNKYDDFEGFFQNSLYGSIYIRYFNRVPRKWLKALNVDSTLNLNYFISLSYAPKYFNYQGHSNKNLLDGKPVLNFNVRYTIFKNIFIEATTNHYIFRKTKNDSDGDFSYGFGYNKYTNLSLAFSYSNYSSNRFPWSKKSVNKNSFLNGNFSLLLNYKW